MTSTFEDYDAIIVGSGAGGCAAAKTLIDAGLRVALVEKGRELPRDESTLDIGKVVHQGIFKSQESWIDGRDQEFKPEEYFNVGGKTKWYGAALLRYSPNEFLPDPAHQCRGWPISYEDLRPYYDAATRDLGVRLFDCEPDLARISATMTARCPEWRSEPMPLGLRRRRFMRPPRFRPGARPGGPFGPYGALSSNVGVHRLSSDRYLIGRVTVDRNLSNMASLFTQIRAVPNLQNSSSNGFRLSEIQPGSIFQQIGLEDGDIVTGAQGQQVNDPMRAMALLNSLRNSPSIRLNLIRHGSPLQLYYTIH